MKHLKITALILAAVMIMPVLFGCNTEPADTPSSETDVTAKTTDTENVPEESVTDAAE